MSYKELLSMVNIFADLTDEQIVKSNERNCKLLIITRGDFMRL